MICKVVVEVPQLALEQVQVLQLSQGVDVLWQDQVLEPLLEHWCTIDHLGLHGALQVREEIATLLLHLIVLNLEVLEHVLELVAFHFVE